MKRGKGNAANGFDSDFPERETESVCGILWLHFNLFDRRKAGVIGSAVYLFVRADFVVVGFLFLQSSVFEAGCFGRKGFNLFVSAIFGSTAVNLIAGYAACLFPGELGRSFGCFCDTADIGFFYSDLVGTGLGDRNNRLS